MMTPGADHRIVVMKFGGTSLATESARSSVIRSVRIALDAGSSPVVVVSAMGRLGDPFATDTLLALLEGAPADPRERDLLMSTGEVVSAVVLAHGLRAAGVDARAFTGADAGIVTDGDWGRAAIAEIHCASLLSAIEAGVVPVVAGFQGVGPDGSITTLGRGGSDTTACALGIALQADGVEIYTDVDGVMTADPRTCDGSTVLEHIGAEELNQMARHGARVVHAPAAELALASGLPVTVRNTYSSHPGTSVVDIASYRPGRVATAVTHTEGVTRFQVDLGAAEGTGEHMAAQAVVYRAMADAAVSLDMFTSIGSHLVFSVDERVAGLAEETLAGLGLSAHRCTGLSKVTLIGAGMHGVPGVMARVAECLQGIGVTVLQTADSHTTISVLVPKAQATAAVRALHHAFELGETEPRST